jgi:hypothetical protein
LNPTNHMKPRNLVIELFIRVFSALITKPLSIVSFRTGCFGFALGLVFLTETASGEVVGYFKFDTFPGGNAVFTDDSGKGLQGLLGHPFSPPRSTPGPSGQASDLAVVFDGMAGLAVDDAAGKVLNILAAPVTLECWVRATNFANVHLGLISYGVPGGRPADRGPGGYKLGIGPTGDILFTLFAVVDVFSGVPYPFDGEWHHVAAVYAAADGVHFYLDGVEVAFVAETRAIRAPGTTHLDIGAQYTGLGRFEGAIDRARISKAALTTEQLDSVAATVKPVQSNTAIFFDFDKASAPYQGQPTGTAVSTAEWVLTHTLHQTDGDPAMVTNDSPSGAAGDITLNFAGADRAVVRDPKGVLNLDRDWTLEAWVKVNPAFDGTRDVIFYYGHPGRGYSLSVNYGAGNQLQVTTLGILDAPATTAPVEPDLWQHLAVAHKTGQSLTYFVNGVELETRPYTGGTRLATTNMVLYIGAEWNGGLPFTGLIDRVRISNTALTAAELDSNPLKPAPVALPPLPLGIVRSQSNVVLSWPDANSTGFVLEFSNSLPASTWSPETTAPVVATGQKTVTIPTTGSTRFYRLRRP